MICAGSKKAQSALEVRNRKPFPMTPSPAFRSRALQDGTAVFRPTVETARAVWSCMESNDLIPRFRG